VAAMREGRDWLRDALGRIRPVAAQRWLRGELAATDVLDLLLTHPGLFEWFRFRSHVIVELVKAYSDCIKGMGEDLTLGCGPRISSLAPLAGWNYGLIADMVDFVSPKLYLWHEGGDGLKGTVGRYASTLMAWNPSLSEDLAIRLVCKAFGIPLPGVASLADLASPFSPEFFARTLPSEIDKAIARTGDASKLRFFAALHHGGVHMSSEEMRGILIAIESSPCDKVLYWNYEDITEEQWTILGEFAA